jgi:hypothetical protein
MKRLLLAAVMREVVYTTPAEGGFILTLCVRRERHLFGYSSNFSAADRACSIQWITAILGPTYFETGVRSDVRSGGPTNQPREIPVRPES